MKPSDVKSKDKQLAVAALFLGAAEGCFLAAILAPLKIEVGHVEEHDAVCRLEKVVHLMAEMPLKLLLYRIEVVCDTVYPPWSYFCHGKVKEITYRRVLLYYGYWF